MTEFIEIDGLIVGPRSVRFWREQASRVEALTAERDTLREALKEIEEFAASKYRPHSLVGLDWERVNDIARAARAKTEQE